MKVLKKWLRTDDEPPVEEPAPRGVSDVPSDVGHPGHAGDYDQDTSFNWRAPETSSSIFDSPDTHRVRLLQSARARPANDDDNPGYDPYDTGRFDANEDS